MVERSGSGAGALQAELQRLRGMLRHADLELDRLRAEAKGDPEDSLLLEANQQLVLALLRGQAELQVAEAAAEDDAGGERDPLTGLLGRAALRERFDAAVVAAAAGGERSVGISIYPDDGLELDRLVHRADRAMYRAKGLGSGHHAFYEAQSAATGAAAAPRVRAQDDSNAAIRLRQSQMQEANEQLLLAALGAQELQSAAERARGDQTALLAVVAHELRNPLTPIRMAAGLLDRVGAGELPRLRAVIERQLDHVSRLVGDLLDISRIHAGKLRLEREPLDLCSLLPQILETCTPAIEARGQHLAVDMPVQPLRVNGDAVRLVQVVSNLLDNASKYTPEQGNIRLAIHGLPDSVVVTVADTGIGIRPAAPRYSSLSCRTRMPPTSMVKVSASA